MPDHISRRRLIAMAAVVPTAAALGAISAEADDGAAMRKQMKYQNTPAKSGAKCSGCGLFRKPSSCTAIPGKISPNGWCVAYVPK